MELFACSRWGHSRFRQHVCQRLHRNKRLEDGDYETNLRSECNLEEMWIRMCQNTTPVNKHFVGVDTFRCVQEYQFQITLRQTWNDQRLSFRRKLPLSHQGDIVCHSKQNSNINIFQLPWHLYVYPFCECHLETKTNTMTMKKTMTMTMTMTMTLTKKS